jgi:hypothetical protein
MGLHPVRHLVEDVARSVGEVRPQASRALWAASSAFSMSSCVERGISQKGLPVTGLMFSKYWPRTGGRTRRRCSCHSGPGTGPCCPSDPALHRQFDMRTSWGAGNDRGAPSIGR